MSGKTIKTKQVIHGIRKLDREVIAAQRYHVAAIRTKEQEQKNQTSEQSDGYHKATDQVQNEAQHAAAAAIHTAVDLHRKRSSRSARQINLINPNTVSGSGEPLMQSSTVQMKLQPPIRIFVPRKAICLRLSGSNTGVGSNAEPLHGNKAYKRAWMSMFGFQRRNDPVTPE